MSSPGAFSAAEHALLQHTLAQRFGLEEHSRMSVGLAFGPAQALWLHAARAAGQRLLVAGGARARRLAQAGRELGLEAAAWDARDFARGFDLELADQLDHHGPYDALLLVARDDGAPLPVRGTHSPLLMVTGLLQAFPDTLYLLDAHGMWPSGEQHSSLGCDRFGVDLALCGAEDWGGSPDLTLFAASPALLERARERGQALPELGAALAQYAGHAPARAALAALLQRCA